MPSALKNAAAPAAAPAAAAAAIKEPERLKLPKPADSAHAFYAVWLKNDRNERGETGPYPAIAIEDFRTALVEDVDHPTRPWRYGDYQDPLERRKAREYPEPVLVQNQFGEPEKFERRAWRMVADGKRHIHLFEDRRATLAHRTSTGIHDAVDRVQLWCPLLGRDFLGNRQEHGEYLGVGETIHGPGRRQKQQGICPTCQRDGTQAEAAKKIAQLLADIAPEVTRA